MPWITTTILEAHKDEVWNIQWSHDGAYLASASRDKSAIIWRRGVSVLCPSGEHGGETNNQVLSKSSGSSLPQSWVTHHILSGHPFSVTSLAWSLDDTILLTSADNLIKLWNKEVNALYRRYIFAKTLTRCIFKTGVCIRTLDDHAEPVTAISWLPDGSGFISGSLDGKIIIRVN